MTVWEINMKGIKIMHKIKQLPKKLLCFIKKETVLSAALLLAIISSFFVPPDAAYIGYIDFRTLSLLLCLMLVMAGLQSTGLFRITAEKLLKRVHGQTGVIFILVMLCFFSSMLITNDVALITFVPFTFTVLSLMGEDAKRRLIIPVVVMQTLAANLGSMLTPAGNPQNLYLHGISGMGIGEFVMLMLPYTAVSFILLCIYIVLCPKSKDGGSSAQITGGARLSEKKRTAVYLALFVLCLLSVARVLDYRLTLIIVIGAAAASDNKILIKADYALLLTFIGFFIFIGNMGRIPAFSGFIESAVKGRECVTGIAASQIISNVPAALLLSGFTDNLRALIVGVNLGGLGTLIASMASLISFKYIGKEDKSLRGKYLLKFTIDNVIFLAVLIATYYIIN